MCLATAALAPGFGVLVVTKARSGLCQLLPKKATNGHASKVRRTRSRSAHIDVSLHSWRRRWKENKKPVFPCASNTSPEQRHSPASRRTAGEGGVCPFTGLACLLTLPLAVSQC